MFPVLKDVVASTEFFDDPKEVYKRYGREKIDSLVAGINNPKAFIIRDGIIYPDAATVASKLTIPDLIYDITEAGVPVNQAVADDKKQIEGVLDKQ